MNVDSTTLADLEVFQDTSGHGGVFALLDHTTTETGRRSLRRRLGSPHHDIASIRAVQRSVAFLRKVEKLPAFVNPGSTEYVERYLGSNMQAADRGLLARLLLAVGYRDIIAEVKEGVRATETWVRQTKSAAKALLALDPPPLIRDLARRVLEALRNVPLPERSASLAETLRLDRAYRVEAEGRLTDAIGALGELDSLRSMAVATNTLRWTLPEVVESDHFLLEGEGLFHPFLENPITNPIDVVGGEPVLFLTGPNMAGKTTYLRAAALVVLLAQVGMSVPAKRVRVTPVELLLTSLNPSDDLRAGLSFFQAEVLRVRDAAAHLAEGKRAFVLFDEVFKGTNVRDALEASASVILGFAKARGSGFIFSSHLVELVDALQADPGIKFRCFDGIISDGRVEYSYRMKEGVSDQRFGLLLFGEARIPELLEQIGR